MSIHVALRHVTRYQYDRLVQLGPQVVRLRPAPHCRTRILSYSMRVEPQTHFVNWQQDPQGNYLARLVMPERTRCFEVAVDLVAEMSVLNPFDFFLEEAAEHFPFDYEPALLEELQPYLVLGNYTPEVSEFVSSISLSRRRTIDFLVELNQALFKKVAYTIRMEPGVQTPQETLQLGSGSCRDSAWLMVEVFRRLGIAARFVSGYLIQLTSDQPSIDGGPDGPAQDFTDLHAWCEVYLPGAGWIGLDPTSGLMAGEGHIPLACSPEPSGAAAIFGGLDECEVEFEHTMSVQRIYESPRTSKPYREETWNAIEAMGHEVDRTLDALDVRLTMGGEPTFVSNTDRASAQWNIDALGPDKRNCGLSLMSRLGTTYGEGGFLHYGQGKWYPGEQLPRWALSRYWAKDGTVLWKNPALFADDSKPGKAVQTHAETFITGLCAQLGVVASNVLPGFEDTVYYLWREGQLPTNVDPHDAKLKDPIERDRLRKIFEKDLGEVVGYCLPLDCQDGQFVTGPWQFRGPRMYLLPGDSPMGYRLPLASLPWAAEKDLPVFTQTDPFSPEQGSNLGQRATGPLITIHTPAQANVAAQPAYAGSGRVPGKYESATNIVRTALCVQVRAGHLYVFMPPLSRLEDYLALLAAVEATAQNMSQTLVLEGYPPPRDNRLTLLQITPDPGVLEVNVQPSRNWAELVKLTTTVYEQARQCGLSAEKFMLDGRHTGTGGGNHLVLGGQTPADSPFLRRPDLLASLLRYWHNHPGLSYLFSGLFIGPTSQAPRVDEARNDQTHELELALHTLTRQARGKTEVPPWLIDRLLRNLLMDASGNTHRCEFSIDKLYNPDGPTGRLGLLELRAFEMPPNARMSLVQQLLLRALVARFWKAPYTARLVNWGTRLHDRFMLSSFVRQDLREVLNELGDAGFALPLEWFEPHFAFRFPLLGDLQMHDMQLELRLALEPWHVLGEEGAIGGTVRYVDSSLERLELKIKNCTSERYTVTCNGFELPLQATGTQGEYVAAVRYKAWQPPQGLHPTIGVHAPLVFDVVDTWNNRSVGGCQYHVAHPGGRNYDIFPVNAFEAESRRLARFFRMGHSHGGLVPKKPTVRPEFPMTLDLRWCEGDTIS